MNVRRPVAACVAMLVAGMLLCGIAVTQLDMPGRPPIDESYDPEAPIPPGYVITTTDPNAVDDSPNGPALSMDAPPNPEPSDVAIAAAPPAQVASAALAVPTVALPPLPNTINIILLGSDHRGQDTDWRTDTMIVVMVDPRSKQAGIISLPRDLWVNIPGRPPNRINTLDEFGGPPLVKQVVGSVLGVPIDYYVRVDFSNFEKAVDTIGGITVDVDCALRESNFVFPAGKTQMDGRTALTFSRLRYSTSVYDRMRRQSRVLWAIREKVLSADVFPHIPDLWNVGRNLIQTDVPPQNIISLASLARDIKPSDIHGLVVDYSMARHATSSQGWWILLPDLNHIRIASRSVFSPNSPTLLDLATKKLSAC